MGFFVFVFLLAMREMVCGRSGNGTRQQKVMYHEMINFMTFKYSAGLL